MKKVYLVGYMGSGKSVIGRRLSYAVKMPFYDMDQEIVKQMGMSISDIFDQYGEEYFRNLETEFLKTFRDERCIIATGGGAAMREENRDLMRKTGLVFFLNTPFTSIWQRISRRKKRPIVQASTKAGLEKLYIYRIPLYTECAHFKVETKNRSLKQITEYISFQIERLK